MALNLKIENETRLPDGGPLEISVTGKRNIDIGRDSHLDWTLPDPTRFISSKHAEIRYRDGGYWLHDVSTNGTFLNGGDHRMQAPHRLRNGDRFTIGHYIIAVALDAEPGEAAASATGVVPPSMPQAAGYQALWDSPQDAAPPIDRVQLRAPRERPAPVNPDFLDWAADVPNLLATPRSPPPPPSPVARGGDDDMGWATGPMSNVPPPPPPAPEMPSPRRPTWTSEPEAPWAAGRASPTPGPQSAPPNFADPEPSWGRSGAAAGTTAPMSVPGGALGSPDQFLRRLAQAAGVPEEVFTRKDPNELADQLGAMTRLVIENVMQLLNARMQAKRLARSSQHTVIQAIDNNPLKFAPSSEEAMRIMFGPASRSYLDARRAVEQSFADLKTHQLKTYAAMQHALHALLSDLDPKSIDQAVEADRGIAGLMTSRKARLWDFYVAQWEAMARLDANGPIDAFMRIFADFYDREGGGLG
jgi:type VI secretion system protein ImpI